MASPASTVRPAAPWLGLCAAGLAAVGLAAVGLAAPRVEAEEAAATRIALPRDDRPIDFATEIRPILQAHCVACHNAKDAQSDLVLETSESLLEGGSEGPAVVAGDGAASLLLQVASGQREPTMPPPENDVGAQPLSPSELGLIQRWIDQGARASAMSATQPATPRFRPLPASVHPILATAVSRDGRYAACGRGNRLIVYGLDDGKEAQWLVDPQLAGAADDDGPGRAHLDCIQSLAFDPSGRRLASGGYRTVKFWQRDSRQEGPQAPEQGEATSGEAAPGDRPSPPAKKRPWRWQRTLGAVDDPHPLRDRVLALAWSPDGSLLATGGGVPSRSGELKIWRVDDGSLVREITDAHSDTVFAVAFGQDGTYLATGGADRMVRVFRVDDGTLVATFEGHTHHVLAVAWSADGRWLASAGADQVVKIWDFEKRRQQRTIAGFQKEVTAVAFVGATTRIVAASGDATTRVFDAADGKQVRTLPGADRTFLHSATASADGQRIVAGGDSGLLFVWNGASGKRIATLGASETQ